MFIVVGTILYYLKFAYKNISKLPSILLLYIFLLFVFFIPADIWNIWFDDEPQNEESQNQQYYFIPPHGHRLYPEWGFKNPWILEDEFHGIKTQEQEDKSFTGNTFEIYKWFQWGIYFYDAWINAPKTGKIYLKAYDILTNTLLSEDRLEEQTSINVYDTNGEIKNFSLWDKYFKIYEWDWWKYYGARFELWYLPLEVWAWWIQKIAEQYYIIDGWER